jgi:hypothetical protein
VIKRLKIDSLFLYLGASIVLILTLWSFQIVELKFENVLSYPQRIDFNSNIKMNDSIDELSVLNPDFELHVSTDGGDHFEKVEDKFLLSELRINDLTKAQNSWRTSASKGDLAQNKSGLFVLVNPRLKTRSNVFPYALKEVEKNQLSQINLTISQNDFLGELDGFYTLGAAAWYGNDYNKSWWERPGNYKERGVKWTKKGFFGIKKESENLVSNVLFKISGNATRGFSQKSFKVYGDKSLNNELIKGDFFGKGQSKCQSMVLRNSGNDNTRTLFADLLMHNLASTSELLVQSGQQSVVYINGNYWGIYNLRERLCIENIALKFNVKEAKVTLLENGAAELKDGDIEQHSKFHKFLKELEKGELSQADVEEEINLNSFIDYIFFETFFANQDWPTNNSMFYKIKKEKWTWILNDMDYSLAYPGSDNVNSNLFETLQSSSSVTASLFNNLIVIDSFKNRFKLRVFYHLENTLNEVRLLGEFQKLQNNISSEIVIHSERWRQFSFTEWEENCQENLSFLLNRSAIYSRQIEGL